MVLLFMINLVVLSVVKYISGGKDSCAYDDSLLPQDLYRHSKMDFERSPKLFKMKMS